MPYLEIREARPEDRAAVLAFCAHTWEWGDYIEFVWDEWLHDPHGALFVATIDGQPVGISRIRMLNETDAWLEGMRVDPVFRHRGLATALHNAQLVEAMKRGATRAGLITESTNTASVSLIERGFFRRMGHSHCSKQRRQQHLLNVNMVWRGHNWQQKPILMT